MRLCIHEPETTQLEFSQVLIFRCLCWSFVFWQVVNHGVPQHVMEEMKASCLRFFQQPPELRNIYRSQSFKDPVAYSTSFNPAKEKANDWKDVLYVRDFPQNPVDGFSIAPDVCRFFFLFFIMSFCESRLLWCVFSTEIHAMGILHLQGLTY